jgi:hypothetical protein
MLIKKEYTLDEAFSEFSHLDCIKMVHLLYEAKLNLLEMLDLISEKQYDAYAFEAEKQLDLIDKNIDVFQVAVMAHEAKIFDKFNIKGNRVLIGNN